jgi:L-aspartate oxidase
MRSSVVSAAFHFDVLIVGSGLAGLSAALLLSAQYRVAIITKRAIMEGSSGRRSDDIAEA